MRSDPPHLITVSRAFVGDWLAALALCCSQGQLQGLLRRAGLDDSGKGAAARVSLDQMVTLYQLAVAESGDEMMGLWQRPVRPRALQHLVTTVASAETLPAALYRFSTFWNLILDDVQFTLARDGGLLDLSLVPQGRAAPQRFGHLLMLKLAHGVLSWRAGYELPVDSVKFAFARPAFAADYSVVFPCPVGFDARRSAIRFETRRFEPPPPRSKSDLLAFVRRAPRDWIFTSYRAHTTSLRVREYLFRAGWSHCGLADTATEFGITPRTLIRRLAAEGASFQSIKDDLRRDIALRALREAGRSTEQIAAELGFSSAANFHRAFRRWTGATPSAFRQPVPQAPD